MTKGYIDDVKVEDIKRFETDLHHYIETDKEGKALLKEIREQKSLPEIKKMNGVIESFKKSFA